MARQKKEDPPKGSPAWMATFSDLMNLLLCFFVLLFSMSSVDAEKFELVVASLKSSFSVLPAGGTTIGEEGMLISSGISQLEQFDIFFEQAEGEETEDSESETETTEMTEEQAEEMIEQQGLEESEEISEEVEQKLTEYGIQNEVEVSFNAQYVLITLNGALLFDSGQSDVREDAIPILTKVSSILEAYTENIIEVEGHTDNVPISNDKYESNDVLSMYRALTVANFIRANTSLDPAIIKSSGRGEYLPVADNSTAEGRAKNRRVEIKIYNSYNSD
ncbi:MAG: flagellar motor protein MotB [Lachnospiraceae bacterium]|nr:flagellar motor protein MotB [Lachnospiraceae bacterium]